MRFRYHSRCLLGVGMGLLVLAVIGRPNERAFAQTAPTVAPIVLAPETTPAIQALSTFIEEQRQEKGIPAISIALVDDQRVVWSAGFGLMHPRVGRKATADTAYCVGSVSKLYTDIAVMQLVEKGELSLDAPIQQAIRRFTPQNLFEQPITLRQLMTHRSGLVREPPVGNYFDSTQPSLEQTVLSLNSTTLVYPPGKRIKYSNAGIAAVGYAVEFSQREAFGRYIQRTLLDPMGMKSTSFQLSARNTPQFADSIMWTHIGKTFPAPTFEMGLGPAGSMISTVNDQTQLLKMIFGNGMVNGVRILKPESLREMLTPQFVQKDDTVKIGLGFFLSEFEGKLRAGHGGAVYGFATEFAAIPSEKLGVVVVCSKDIANAVSTRIADEALRLMLATKAGKPLPTIARTSALDPARCRVLAGRYQNGTEWIDLLERDGRLWMLPSRGGYRVELKGIENDLIGDDVHSYGTRLKVEPGKLIIRDRVFTQVNVPLPSEIPDNWKGLIGDYGENHNVLTILEKDGKLHALIEWAFLYPLTQEADDVFAFPSYGLYQDEKLIFTRDAKGRAESVKAAEVTFNRRRIAGENGELFKIRPTKAIPALRDAALKAQPTVLPGKFREPELVDLQRLDPSLKFDIRYATENNFLGTPVYTSARAFMQKPAAEALLRVHQKLESRGLGLVIFDAYRPWHVTKIFWDATPANQKNFVADPSKGSRHNRGCAVDLSLYDRKTGQVVMMPSGFDEFSDRAYPDYLGGTARQRWFRDLLREAMQEEGFTVYSDEWWHFDFRDWQQYNLLNATFEELKR
ncbi:serine hydrolase [Tuwongella immobilis]|uniref:D-alanyl-D-alanine dipeptidase n=1 Tax=Tuwongella immobilis TaxID=692036 RepID=A0A6C2YNF5_9BACT|nr:serine hydrolase [Tuwongella immobilis]VIP02422.1 beta-lactamase : D-alanyl-D-alanine dipeptidase OS=Singulisphaera acidiphila (strain ATCC BAA-1392 / DSM 18658 / VKM B-2454 / MOB10) GN=Sinac_2843 PE=4 SV=1: Beta-lactamase: Peptidase_M15 [Tuwongella immobilis]VTS01351.1 beta-lactamase : D-alanyl-D-alanine dipeptidase OS=Singulisphaera acidiphila (strain ATCC BAA-1392 / DSM 18658 / VKM B-2454 / MOB10) GN=Sinac_2843 PE=4 SV=1: Beta-lactamase: Peptidase_M15 [Tuwongella immobilis]